MAIIEEVVKAFLFYIAEQVWGLLKRAINSYSFRFITWIICKFILYVIVSSIIIWGLIIVHLSLSDRIMLHIEDFIWDAYTDKFIFINMNQELANKIKFTVYYGFFSIIITSFVLLITSYKNRYDRLRELKSKETIEKAIINLEIEREGVKTLMNLSKNIAIRLDANLEIMYVNNNFYKHIEVLFDSIPTELNSVEKRSFTTIFYWLADLRTPILASFIDEKCNRIYDYHATLPTIDILYDILIEPSIYRKSVICVYIYLIVKNINKQEA